MATRIDITLEGLQELQGRIDRRQLDGEDWVVVGALVSKLITRTEARQARLKAKAAGLVTQNEPGQTKAGPANDVDHSPDAEDTAAGGESSEPAPPGEPAPGEATGPGEPARADSTRQDPPKKGHGRNGADAFVSATKYVHDLAAGIVGAICADCGVGRVSPYRDKVTIRVVGQPLFAAERRGPGPPHRRARALLPRSPSATLCDSGLIEHAGPSTPGELHPRNPWAGSGPMVNLEATRIAARCYATFLHRSGNEQLDGSPPQMRT